MWPPVALHVSKAARLLIELHRLLDVALLPVGYTQVVCGLHISKAARLSSASL